MSRSVAIKVDVCNRFGLERGVPKLLETFAEAGVRASFFVSFGPDHSGRALRRIFRRGFLTKMLRTRALRMYDAKTLLAGTLLPAPLVGDALPELLREVESGGHELGLHGWDHVRWHDRLQRMSPDQIRAAYSRAVEGFQKALGRRPRFSGAPAWHCTAESLKIQEDLKLAFASDCRGAAPFYPVVDGERLSTLQVPTTLPTSDELLGVEGIGEDALPEHYLSCLSEPLPNVLGVHAELEGLHVASWLPEFLHRARADGVAFATVGETANAYRETRLSHGIVQRRIPGRAGTVAAPAA